MTQLPHNESAADRQPAAEAVQRFAVSVEYDGSHYHGWQAQRPGIRTVQREVEAAIAKVANHPLTVICAGRTDTGVHGCNQIIHFDSPAIRSERSWIHGANSSLPNDVAVRWVQPVSEDFHARFSAVYRRYRYVILNTPVRPAHMPKGVTWSYPPLDIVLMKDAAQYLEGEHDFSSFRAIGCQAKSPVKTVHHLRVERFGDLIVIDVKANAFLHHMVRNIAGVLMAIGCGKWPVSWVSEVLTARDRTQGGVTAQPHGLYFVDVGYPEQFDLPSRPLGPYFLSPWLMD